MNVVRIFIGESELQLYQDTEIGLSFKIADIAEFTSVQSNVSTSIDIPYNETNANILEHAIQVNSNTTIPYSANDCTLIINGIYIFQKGVLVLEESNIENFVITVYSGNISLFKNINGDLQTLRSLGKHVFNRANILAGLNNSVGDYYGYPLVDYGNLLLAPESIQLFGGNWVKDIFELIIDSTDRTYAITGNFWDNDTLFNSMFVPFSNDVFQNNTTYVNDVSVSLFNASLENVTDTQNINTVNLYTLTGVSYSPTQYNNQQYTLSADITNFSKNTPVGTNVKVYLSIAVNGSLPILPPSTESLEITGDGNYTFTTSFVESNAPDSVELVVSAVFTSTGSNASFNLDIENKDISTFEVDRYIYYDKTTIYNTSLLPPISRVDFVKDILNQFGLIFQTNELLQTVELKRFEDIISNKSNSVDWSNKIDFSKKYKVEYEAEGYGKINTFLYTPDDNVTQGLGDSEILINNDNLPDTNNFTTLSFSASNAKPSTPYLYAAQIIKLDNTYNEQDELTQTKPRILYTTEESGSITIVDDSGSSNTTGYKIGRFISPLESDNLGFDNSLIENYYQGLQGVIQNYKKVTAFFNLNELDIQGLNFFNPVYVNATNGRIQINGYFYINRINNFVGGSSTEVELIKLDI